MPQMDFFPQRPEVHPMIYAYRDLNPDYDGLLKVGYTEKDVDRRVAQQYPTKRPDGKLPYEILYRSSAMREDGSCFTDHDVHRMLRRRKITGVGGEWFRCTVDELEAAVLAVKTDTLNEENRTRTFAMRPEQEEAVNKTIAYFRAAKQDAPDRAPKFLWNAKMRFGKTFASYELAKRMGLKKVLVLTFKPAVEAAWEEDLMTHKDFEGWQFICRDGMRYAVFRYPAAECAVSYLLVSAQCGQLLRHVQSAAAEAEQLLPRLPHQCLRRDQGGHWRGCAGAGAEIHG